MTLRELAEVLLTARRQAKPFSEIATLSMSKLSPLGFTARDVRRVEDAVEEIERFTADKLAELGPR